MGAHSLSGLLAFWVFGLEHIFSQEGTAGALCGPRSASTHPGRGPPAPVTVPQPQVPPGQPHTPREGALSPSHCSPATEAPRSASHTQRGVPQPQSVLPSHRAPQVGIRHPGRGPPAPVSVPQPQGTPGRSHTPRRLDGSPLTQWAFSLLGLK